MRWHWGRGGEGPWPPLPQLLLPCRCGGGWGGLAAPRPGDRADPARVGSAKRSLKWRHSPVWGGGGELGSPRGAGRNPPGVSSIFLAWAAAAAKPHLGIISPQKLPCFNWASPFIFSPEPRIAVSYVPACGMVVLHSRWFALSISPVYVTQRCTKAGFWGKENPLWAWLFNSRHS